MLTESGQKQEKIFAETLKWKLKFIYYHVLLCDIFYTAV